MTMTTKDPTPEAIEFSNAIGVAPYGYRRAALALDAWGMALLRRREEAPGPDAPGTHEGCTAKEWYDRASRTWQTLLDEKAAHAVTRSRLEFLEGYRSVVEPELEALKAGRVKSDEQIEALVRQRNLIQMRQDALRGELDATRKELTITGQALDEAHVRVDGVCEANRELRRELEATTLARDNWANEAQRYSQGLDRAKAELESLRKPLEGELAEDVAHLDFGCAEAFVMFDSANRNGVPLAAHQLEWLEEHRKFGHVDRVRAALRAKGEPQTHTACSECKKVSCWKGVFMCESSGSAGTAQLSVAELVALGREHSDYWDGTYEKGFGVQPPRCPRVLRALLDLYEAAKKCDPALTDIALEEPGRSIARAAEIVSELLAKEEPQAAEPPEPRPIVVGSNWAHVSGSPKGALGVRTVEAVDVYGLGHVKLEGITGTWGDNFRNEWAWLNDPEPATPAPEPRPKEECSGCNAPTTGDPHKPDCGRERCAGCGEPKRDHGACGKADNFACNEFKPATPAPELPRKVEPGTTLTVGARYRITEIASWDEDPEHKVGDELYAVEDAFNAGGLESSVFRDRHSRHWKAHTHESCTYVTGLELVAEPGESK